VLSDIEGATLAVWVADPHSSEARVRRARIVLACAEGLDDNTVAAQMGLDPATVRKWRRRFVAHGVEGLTDAPRSGGPRTITDEEVAGMITKTVYEIPAGVTAWSTRSMAEATGMSQSAVSRMWRAFGLKPHLSEPLRRSAGRLVDEVLEVVGVYLNGPDAAFVLCVDRDCRLQSCDDTMVAAPPRRGGYLANNNRPFDLGRVLEGVSGRGLDDLTAHQRVPEFRSFLNLVDRGVPSELDIHVIADRSVTQKAPEISRWLARHRRFSVQLTATHDSWIELVAQWCAELTAKALRRGCARSGVTDVDVAIRSWVQHREGGPRPFVSRQTSDQVLHLVASCGRRPSDPGQPPVTAPGRLAATLRDPDWTPPAP